MLLLLPAQDFLRSGCDLEVSLKDLRLLLPTLSADAASIAGQAVALSQWHQVRASQPAAGSRAQGAGSAATCKAGQPSKAKAAGNTCLHST